MLPLSRLRCALLTTKDRFVDHPGLGESARKAKLVWRQTAVGQFVSRQGDEQTIRRNKHRLELICNSIIISIVIFFLSLMLTPIHLLCLHFLII
ncbi:unnamed protein product [Protopolystoma xenopodis]|uniref:Uncharacterized protein n=1 Tax=Protopolystoma xenopodis TaxID=117903 RepID=A0A448XE32_9PLAT|nr:unnamed protein product [Protopolystoma xenopodis]